MRLESLDLGNVWEGPLPEAVQALAEAAQSREDLFRIRRSADPVDSFHSSNFAMVWRAFERIRAKGWVEGNELCEWGSGLGVVSCLWAMQGGAAWGIEADAELVEVARQMATVCQVQDQTHFVQGNFLPAEAERWIDALDDVGKLQRGGADGHRLLGRTPDSFGLIYAYPWPGERRLFNELFARVARPGALLLSFHGSDELRLQRKPETDEAH